MFILVSATIWPVLQDPDQVLAFNDGSIELALSPVFHFPEALIRIWDNQTFFGNGGGQYQLSFVGLGETIGSEFWRRWAVPWVSAFCSLGIYWAFRQYRIGRFAAALATIIMIFAGWPFNSAITGLAVRMIALTCSALALGFVERGRITDQWLPYLIGGGFLGLAVSEVPDIGLLFAFSTAAIFWWTHLWGKEDSEFKIQNSEAANQGKKLCARSRVSSKWSYIPKFALYVTFSIIICWQTINVMFSTQIQGVTQGASESSEQRFNWATQWSLPPAELWNTVSGSYFGTTINSLTKPYWGRMGRDANWETTHQGFRNFALSGWHIGVIPCTLMIALAVLAIRQRSQNAEAALPPSPWLWLVLGGSALAMMLMWGRFFFVYKLFWSLPYMSTFRNAEKWNGPFLLLVGLGCAFVLDAVRKSLSSKEFKTGTLWRVLTFSFAFMAGLALLIAIFTSGQRERFISARAAEGYQDMAALMWQNAVDASFKVFFIAGLCALGAWWIGRRQAKGIHTSPIAVLSVIGLIALSDLTFNNLPYVQGHKYKHYLQPNPLTEYLDAHRTEGRIKIMPPNHPLLNNLRLTQLQIKGYDLFDPTSISRMPTDYEAFFKALEKNPTRLWEIGSIRYFLTLPGAVEELNKLDGNRGRFIERLALGVGIVDGAYIPMNTPSVSQRYLRLVEFTGALPKYRLISEVMTNTLPDSGDAKTLSTMASALFDPARTVILNTTNRPPLGPLQKTSITVQKETSVEVQLSITTDSPCILVRSSKFDPNWIVHTGDTRLPLLRANYFFQCVSIPAGTHEVTFSYRPSLKLSAEAAIGRLILISTILLTLSMALQHNCRQKPTALD